MQRFTPGQLVLGEVFFHHVQFNRNQRQALRDVIMQFAGNSFPLFFGSVNDPAAQVVHNQIRTLASAYLREQDNDEDKLSNNRGPTA